MATHSSTLAWKIPWMEELVGYSPWVSKSQTRLSDFTHSIITFSIRKIQFWRRYKFQIYMSDRNVYPTLQQTYIEFLKINFYLH